MAETKTSPLTKTIIATMGAALVGVIAASTVVSFFLLSVITAGSKHHTQQAACLPGSSAATVLDTAAYSGEWVNPAVGPIMSRFGWRELINAAGSNMHSGVDVGAPYGHPILAAADGIVSISGPSSGGNTGYMVAIEHGGGVQTRYVHSYAHQLHVKVGQEVHAGEHIADVGSSGFSTGPHLHFEVRIHGEPIEPMAYLAARGVQLGSSSTPDQDIVRAAKKESTISTATPFTKANGEQVSFDADQLANLNQVIAAVKEEKLPARATVIALMTVLQESHGYMYANSTVPASLQLPHQKIGSDHDSVGLFQQRPAAGWGTVEELMDIPSSTKKFLTALKKVPNWESMSPGQAAQAVQISAYPDAYDTWEPVAVQLAKGIPGVALPTGSCTPDIQGITTDLTQAVTAASIHTQALNHHKGTYKEGGNTTKGWDDEGYTQTVLAAAGRIGIPYADIWHHGTPTTNPTEGDLVATEANADGSYNLVGIKTTGNYFLTITPKGPQKLPIPRHADFYDMSQKAATND